MKIYAVTTGAYSNYHIVALTLDKKIAKKLAEKFSGEYNKTNIEVYEDGAFMLRNFFKVTFWFGRTEVRKLNEYEFNELTESGLGKCYMPNAKREDYIIVAVEADNEEAAIKIAAEKKAEFLAEKYGI